MWFRRKPNSDLFQFIKIDMNTFKAFMLLLWPVFITSCIFDNEVCESVKAGREVQIKLNVSSHSNDGLSTRAFSETAVSDLHVFVYDAQNKLVGHKYNQGNSLTMTTRSGNDNRIYAITNTGNPAIFTGYDVSDSIKLKSFTTPNATTVNDVIVNECLTMSGSKGDIDILEQTSVQSISGFIVSRMVAKIVLDVKSSASSVCTGYSVNDMPVKSYYLPRPNTLEALAADLQIGDDAVDASNPLHWFSTGLQTPATSDFVSTFYMYENRRGGRVSIAGSTGNETLQYEKSIYAPERATYIEFYVNVGGTNTTYKLYLGADATKNYNIKRNATYTFHVIFNANGMTVSNVDISEWTDSTTGEEINY